MSNVEALESKMQNLFNMVNGINHIKYSLHFVPVFSVTLQATLEFHPLKNLNAR